MIFINSSYINNSSLIIVNVVVRLFLTNYVYNKILQELTTEVNYLKDSDVVDLERSKGYTNELEKITRNDNNLGETINLKTAAVKKTRLRVTGYSQGEYLYVLSQLGSTMIHKIYTIKKGDSYVRQWREKIIKNLEGKYSEGK